MSQSQAAAIAIVTSFLVGTIASESGPNTIRKDYPSGAAAKVSHNRPVRMSKCQVVAIAIVTAFLIGIFALDGDPDTIRKDYPSGAAAKVSHNRPVRMSQEHGPGWGPGWRPIHHTPWS